MRSSLPRHVKRVARTLPATISRPPYVPPGHFYSPLTAAGDVERALSARDDPSVRNDGTPGVDLRAEAQLALAEEFLPSLDAPFEGPRYAPGNGMYDAADAAVYRAMARHLRPRRVMEIGSGHSTALLLDTVEDVELTCVEPYADRLRSVLRDDDRVEIVERPVQDVPLESYASLGAGDILFIDSTHVVKAGSDVVWLFLQVLPRLAAGVVVHVHDVFWPFEYPAAWLREGRDWTEDYLLHAFLAGNGDWEILLFSSWLWKEHHALIPASLKAEEPGSIWLRRT
ncbi:class I SAM-dependent methyltransferase [Spirillospora sp. NPDC047279]|uniref:class I SAM-dependent methyltransferase n=1 Tax=Spirillospora sp. NPDC047279 TaxID=3155478 RepID=UPI003400CE21